MKIVLTVFLLFLMAGSAGAVVDPDPNSLGIYFDLNADINYLDVAPDTEFPAYVMLTNPTWDFVAGVEFGVDLVVPPGMEAMLFRLATNYPPTAMVVVAPDLLHGSCLFGMSTPYPTSEATVLVEWLFLITAPVTIEFYLGPSYIPSSIPEYFPIIGNENDELMRIGVSSGDVTLPVAEVNTGHQPVAAESVTWGGVKSLYR